MGRVDYNLKQPALLRRYLRSAYTRDAVPGTTVSSRPGAVLATSIQSASSATLTISVPRCSIASSFRYNRINGTIVSGAPFQLRRYRDSDSSHNAPDWWFRWPGTSASARDIPALSTDKNYHFQRQSSLDPRPA